MGIDLGAGVEHAPVRQQVQPWVHRRREGREELRSPATRHRVELDRLVGATGFQPAREGHRAPVGQGHARRIPAAARHVLNLAELSRRRVEDGRRADAAEGVVLQIAADGQDPSVWQERHRIAEEIPGDGLGGEGAGDRVPHRGPIRGDRGVVLGARDDEHATGAQQRRVDGVDRHGLPKRLPLAHDVDLRLGGAGGPYSGNGEREHEGHEREATADGRPGRAVHRHGVWSILRAKGNCLEWRAWPLSAMQPIATVR